jgi:apolipoprotein N-acyltransferase
VKKLALLLALACAVAVSGCGTATSWLKDTADEVNVAAFEGKVDAVVVFCDRHTNPACWKHHG